MAMKKRQVAKAPEQNDNTITKAAYGLGIFVLLLMAISRIIPYYEMNGYLFQIQDTLEIVRFVFLGLSVVSFAVWFMVRKKSQNLFYLFMALGVFFFLCAFTSHFLYDTWVSQVSLLYIGYVALLIVYLVHLLYPVDFLLITLSIVASGVAFYAIRKGHASVIVLTLAFAYLVLCGLISYFGGKNQGKVGKFQVFSPNFNPLNLYINCALWLVCLVLALVLGPVFAYYCIFAAGAVWLIFAVFYTVKLS